MSDPSPHDAGFHRPNSCARKSPTVFKIVDAQWENGACTHCGSITVASAIKYLKQPGTKFSGADWKYGWPHKFYLDPVNPDAAKIVEVGYKTLKPEDTLTENDFWTCFAHKRRGCACPKEINVTGYWSRPVMGTQKHLHVKFYNSHLADATPAEFAEFAELSKKVFGIRWSKDERGSLKYQAPNQNYYGFQLAGVIDANGNPDHSVMESHR